MPRLGGGDAGNGWQIGGLHSGRNPETSKRDGLSNPSAALRQAAAAGLKSRLCRWSMVDARTMTQKVPSRHLAREREADFVPHAVMPDEGHTRGRVLPSSCHDARAGCDANALQWGRRGENPHQKIAKNAYLSYPIMCIWPL